MKPLSQRTALSTALGSDLWWIVRHPLSLLRGWNWKAALFSAMLRGLLFFFTNLHAGHASAAKALLVEWVYAPFAAGIAGAVTQRLRHAEPRALTALVIWLGVPSLMLTAQAVVHHLMATPRVRTGLIASFVFASVASGFNWFAMSRGAFVTGENRSFARDLLLVPKLVWQFLTTLVPRPARQ